MKVLSVVGTRPNFIKEYSINREFINHKVEEIIVHTGQHYDYEMSHIFFKELNIPKPHYINEIFKGSHGQETAAMLSFIEDVLLREKPDVTLVYGDVNSTLAGAIASSKLRIPVVHIEAGLRSSSPYNPEEINRKVADVVSEILFPHIQEAYDSLIKEGYPKEKIYLVGDVIMDTLLSVLKEFKIEVVNNNYYVATIHREENVESKERLTSIINAFIESGVSIKFPMHPRTNKKLKEYGLYNKLLDNPNIELLPPLGYIDFVKLLSGAKKVLTDSGGVRREAYILQKPVITLINIIWVHEMVKCGWSRIVDADKNAIVDAIHNHNPLKEKRVNIFGDGTASKRIVEILLKRFS